MVLDRLDRDVPAFDRMALLAVGAHLPLMDIGVTVGAASAHIRKDRLGVALRAGHAGVHAA
jgi:hypothetical protein